jgi:hypothetical protein
MFLDTFIPICIGFVLASSGLFNSDPGRHSDSGAHNPSGNVPDGSPTHLLTGW